MRWKYDIWKFFVRAQMHFFVIFVIAGLNVGANGSVLVKFLPPKQVINNIYINPLPNVRVDDFIMV